MLNFFFIFHEQTSGDPEWTKCTLSCGGGIQKNIDNSSILRTCNTMPCPGKLLLLVLCRSPGLKTRPILFITIYDLLRAQQERIYIFFSCWPVKVNSKNHTSPCSQLPVS